MPVLFESIHEYFSCSVLLNTTPLQSNLSRIKWRIQNEPPGDNDLILDLHGAESAIDLEQHLAPFVRRSTPVDAPINYAPVRHYVRLEPVRSLLRNPDSVRPCVPAEKRRIILEGNKPIYQLD